MARESRTKILNTPPQVAPLSSEEELWALYGKRTKIQCLRLVHGEWTPRINQDIQHLGYIKEGCWHPQEGTLFFIEETCSLNPSTGRREILVLQKPDRSETILQVTLLFTEMEFYLSKAAIETPKPAA